MEANQSMNPTHMSLTTQLPNGASLSFGSRNSSIVLDLVELPQTQFFSTNSSYPQLSPSPLPSPSLSPLPCSHLAQSIPSLNASASSTSLNFVPSPTPDWLLLSQFVGDWVAVADSQRPSKYDMSNIDASSSTKRIVFVDGIYQVLFSKYAGMEQDFQIHVANNARFHLFSPSEPNYSYFLRHSPIGVLIWENEFDPTHTVTWRQIISVLPMEHFFSKDRVANDVLSPQSSIDSEGTSSSSTLTTMPLFMYPSTESFVEKTSGLGVQFGDPESPFPTSCFLDDPEDQPRSRRSSLSPERRDSNVIEKKTLKANNRDSKQNLVNEVEPQVDELIECFYARKEDYRPNQSGRVGPPVLRGDDVLFIPAKKQAALENVVEFLELIQQNFTILAAAKVCQKKKKRQRKGFLIYLKLQSAAEVSQILRQYYPRFELNIQGVKTAIFKEKKSTAI